MKRKQSILKITSMFAFLIVLISACTKDDDPIIPTPAATVETTLSGVITDNRTLTNDKIWSIDGRVVVANGATLTIMPGTILKAFPGTGNQASTLIIARGGKIDAQGTADQPIIMTTTSDNIAIGETSGTNLSVNDRGLWGGLLLLGYAPGSFAGDVLEVQIEGVPASDTNGLFGGTNPTDNSGSLTYVSIRHGGAEIGEGNEINGLTLGGVGSETRIENIEIVANVDDGIEFFGGTVNVQNVLVWGQGDDGIDIDQAYAGTVSNSVVVLGDASDHALEIDGPEGSLTGSFTVDGLTLIGNASTENGEYADYRSNAMGVTQNVLAYGFQTTSDVELDNDGVSVNYSNGLLSFNNWQIVLPTGVANAADIFVDKSDIGSTFGTDADSFSSSVNVDNATTGANLSDFSWTFASEKGAF